MKVVLHPLAEAQVAGFITNPAASLLVYGTPGVGRRTVAKEIARQLNCTGCSDTSCRSCHMAVSGNHPNITLLEPDSKGKIGIEPVHELQHDLRYRQYEKNGRRVVIIASADTLTLPAQNALLKTLEEPPSDTTIILTATSPTALLPTVVSRCRHIFLPPVADAAIASLTVGQTGATPTPEAIAQSHGLPGKAIAYATDPVVLAAQLAGSEIARRFMQAGSLFERLQLANQIAAAENRATYLDALVADARRAARQGVPQAAAQLVYLERLLERLRANVNARTALEALAVELA